MWLLVFTLGCVVLGGALFLLGVWLYDSDLDRSDFWVIMPGIIMVCGVLIAGCGVIIGGGTALERAYGRNACHSYGAHTGRPVRFAIIGALDSGTCLTRGADGKWIPTSQLRQVNR